MDFPAWPETSGKTTVVILPKSPLLNFDSNDVLIQTDVVEKQKNTVKSKESKTSAHKVAAWRTLPWDNDAGKLYDLKETILEWRLGDRPFWREYSLLRLWLWGYAGVNFAF